MSSESYRMMDSPNRCGSILSSWHIPSCLVTILLLLLGTRDVFGFTESTIQRFAQASSLSYLDIDRMQTSPYFESSRMEPIAQVVDPQTESGATLFWCNHHNKSGDDNNPLLVVACRGSANPKNFGTNLKFNLVPATRLSLTRVPENAMVHDGFQDASVGLWRRLGPHLINVLRQHEEANQKSDVKKTLKLVFTGHSLGAATALLSSVHYQATFGRESWFVSPTIITFGGPKLCNSILARYLRTESLRQSDILHLVHSKDPVLANNQKLWKDLGFEDVGIELECDPKLPVVYTDDSGNRPKPKRKGLFGRFAWNIMDHCNYMGIFVGPRL